MCWWHWFSGFFGLACLMHIIRLISGFPVVINNFEIPMYFSIIACVVAGALSIFCCIKGCNKSCCKT